MIYVHMYTYVNTHPYAEARGLRGGVRSAGTAERTADSGQRTAGGGRRAAGCGQRAAGSWQWAAGSSSEQQAAGSGPGRRAASANQFKSYTQANKMQLAKWGEAPLQRAPATAVGPGAVRRVPVTKSKS